MFAKINLTGHASDGRLYILAAQRSAWVEGRVLQVGEGLMNAGFVSMVMGCSLLARNLWIWIETCRDFVAIGSVEICFELDGPGEEMDVHNIF